MNFRKILVVFLSLLLLIAQNTFAQRLGGGRSYGMQRSNFSKQGFYQNRYNPQEPRYNNTNNYQNPGYQQPQRQGMGALPAAAIGAAAGAAGGYMLGRSMNNGNYNNYNASAPQVNANSMATDTNHFPWGIITVLVLILALGLIFFKRNRAPQLTNNNSYGSYNNANSNSYNNDNNNNNQQTSNSNQNTSQSPPAAASGNAAAAQMPPTYLDKMPDGVEIVYFLRQVKGMFLHVQSMNNQENLAEIAKYMTTDLYQELQASIQNNSIIADFKNLDCHLLTTSTENNQFVASVLFMGLVSEDPNSSDKTFKEIWNFVKSDATEGKWLIAGIEQPTPAA